MLYWCCPLFDCPLPRLLRAGGLDNFFGAWWIDRFRFQICFCLWCDGTSATGRVLCVNSFCFRIVVSFRAIPPFFCACFFLQPLRCPTIFVICLLPFLFATIRMSDHFPCLSVAPPVCNHPHVMIDDWWSQYWRLTDHVCMCVVRERIRKGFSCNSVFSLFNYCLFPRSTYTDRLLYRTADKQFVQHGTRSENTTFTWQLRIVFRDSPTHHGHHTLLVHRPSTIHPELMVCGFKRLPRHHVRCTDSVKYDIHPRFSRRRREESI